jgi:hypothetical protein
MWSYHNWRTWRNVSFNIITNCVALPANNEKKKNKIKKNKNLHIYRFSLIFSFIIYSMSRECGFPRYPDIKQTRFVSLFYEREKEKKGREEFLYSCFRTFLWRSFINTVWKKKNKLEFTDFFSKNNSVLNTFLIWFLSYCIQVCYTPKISFANPKPAKQRDFRVPLKSGVASKVEKLISTFLSRSVAL